MTVDSDSGGSDDDDVADDDDDDDDNDDEWMNEWMNLFAWQNNSRSSRNAEER